MEAPERRKRRAPPKSAGRTGRAGAVGAPRVGARPRILAASRGVPVPGRPLRPDRMFGAARSVPFAGSRVGIPLGTVIGGRRARLSKRIEQPVPRTAPPASSASVRGASSAMSAAGCACRTPLRTPLRTGNGTGRDPIRGPEVRRVRKEQKPARPRTWRLDTGASAGRPFERSGNRPGRARTVRKPARAGSGARSEGPATGAGPAPTGREQAHARGSPGRPRPCRTAVARAAYARADDRTAAR